MQSNNDKFSESLGWVFIALCAFNVLINMIMLTFRIVIKIIDLIKENNEEKETIKLFTKRNENLAIIESSEL